MLVRVILVLLSRWDKHFKLGRPFIGKLWEEISKFPSPDYWNTSSSDDLCGEELQNVLGRKYKISFEETYQFCLEKVKMVFVGNIKDIPAWLLEHLLFRWSLWGRITKYSRQEICNIFCRNVQILFRENKNGFRWKYQRHARLIIGTSLHVVRRDIFLRKYHTARRRYFGPTFVLFEKFDPWQKNF